MWLFSTPQNYSEMLKKIATTTFFVSLIIIMALSHSLTELSKFLKDISFGVEYSIGGFNLNISYLYFPLLFALAENIFKLHDVISDIFGIRYSFDRNVIILKFLQELKLADRIYHVNKKNRSQIMSDIFYKHASSTSPQIDRHLIDMALGAWSWYWIMLDTIFCLLVLGFLLLLNYFTWTAFFTLLGIVVSLWFVMLIINNMQCKKYARLEVKAILSIKSKRSEIKRYLSDAL